MREDTSENPDRVKATQERRRSNAAGTHQDKRAKRQRTRDAELQAQLDNYKEDE